MYTCTKEINASHRLVQLYRIDAASNRESVFGPRCCGDMDHFDLSVWAFEKVRLPPVSICCTNGNEVLGYT